jgi:ribosomal protein L35AE/L33A
MVIVKFFLRDLTGRNIALVIKYIPFQRGKKRLKPNLVMIKMKYQQKIKTNNKKYVAIFSSSK